MCFIFKFEPLTYFSLFFIGRACKGLRRAGKRDFAAKYFMVKENGKIVKDKIMHLKSLMTGSSLILEITAAGEDGITFNC